MFKYRTIRQLLNDLITSCNGWDKKHGVCVFLYLINEAIPFPTYTVNVWSKAHSIISQLPPSKLQTHTFTTLIAFIMSIWAPCDAHYNSNIQWWAWCLSSVANMFDLFAASSLFVWVSAAFLIYVGCMQPNQTSTASSLLTANRQRIHANNVCTYGGKSVKLECSGAEADYPGYIAFIVYSTLAACRTFNDMFAKSALRRCRNNNWNNAIKK